MWVEFVVGSYLCSEGFSPGSLVFLQFPHKNISKFQVDLATADEQPLFD